MFSSLFLGLALASVGVLAGTPGCADGSALPPGPYCPGKPVTPAQQRAIFERFTNLFLVKGAFHTAFSEHVAETYIQHNPMFLSGRQNALNGLGPDIADPAAAGFPANIITQSFDAQRQIGMFHYYFTPANGTQPTVIVDILRMNGSCIEEHWDVMQQRPANATNPLAMFTPPTK